MKIRSKNGVLVIIVLAQFCCTSLWFASNGVLDDLISAFSLSARALGHLTTAIQLGFIAGTLVFAAMRIVDRFSPSRVFLWSALAGALVNVCILFPGNSLVTLLALRFTTGFFLAGIYPVGMKIAADYFDRNLGPALGLLVGALVLGTAFPHLLRALSSGMDWRPVLMVISAIAGLGGVSVGLLLEDGPHRRAGQKLNFNTMFTVFKPPKFRSAAFGYFGHMWELYAFWAFVPVAIGAFLQTHTSTASPALWAFIVIAIGGVACVVNGYLSRRIGLAVAANIALVISGVCCLLSPLAFVMLPAAGFFCFLLVWGMAVVADSPMFSTLVAQEAAAETRGTALTIVVCIGFAITILSIQLLNIAGDYMDVRYLFLLLIPGPVFGLMSMLIPGRSVR